MDKYQRAALDVANKARSVLGLPPVGKLYKGKRMAKNNCPITNTIYDDDLDREKFFVETDYSRVFPTPKDVVPGFITIEENVDRVEPEDWTEVAPLFQEEPDELTHTFLEKFDNGEYPDLEE